MSLKQMLRQIAVVITGGVAICATLSAAVLLGYGLMTVFYILAAWRIEGKNMVEWAFRGDAR